MSNNIKNQSAERTLSVIATIFLVLGIIAGVLSTIGGFVAYGELSEVNNAIGQYGEYSYQPADSVDVGMTSAIYSIVMGIFIIIASIYQWAIVKVFVNISHNTASLDSRLENIENKLHQ